MPFMTDGHFTPDRALKIVEENKLDGDELANVRQCATCNGWLRAFAKLAKLAGKKSSFQIPPSPGSD